MADPSVVPPHRVRAASANRPARPVRLDARALHLGLHVQVGLHQGRKVSASKVGVLTRPSTDGAHLLTTKGASRMRPKKLRPTVG